MERKQSLNYHELNELTLSTLNNNNANNDNITTSNNNNTYNENIVSYDDQQQLNNYKSTLYEEIDINISDIITIDHNKIVSLYQYFPKRIIIIILIIICTAISYSDRANISYAIIEMSKDYNYTEKNKGVIFASFFFGYIISQIPSGYISDKYGGKHVLTIASIGWSLFTLLTPIASSNFSALIFCRILLGLSEGFAFPCINALIIAWIPPSEKSRAVSAFGSGIPFGVILAAFISPAMIDAYHWPSIFYLFGVLGICWSLFWNYWASNSPSEHRTINKSEIQYIQNSMEDEKNKNNESKLVPWRTIFTTRSLWGYFLNMMASAWMPTYFNETFHVDIQTVGIYSVIPYICQAIAGPSFGILSDYLLKREVGSRYFLCSTMQGVALFGPMFFFILLGFTPVNAPLAIFYFTSALTLNSASNSGVSVYHLMIIPEFAGLVFSLGNVFGLVPGAIGILVSGSLLESYHSWPLIFSMGIGCYVVGIFSWFSLTNGTPIDYSDELNSLEANGPHFQFKYINSNF